MMHVNILQGLFSNKAIFPFTLENKMDTNEEKQGVISFEFVLL